MYRITVRVAIISSFVLFLAAPIYAVVNSYSENFTTTTYQGYATLWWDTGAGEIKLYPWDMDLVNSYSLGVSTRDVSIDGDNLYVGTSTNLRILDVTTTSPSVLGTAALPDVQAVTGSGSFAYVTTGGFFITVDVSDRTAPSVIGSLSLLGTGVDHDIYGTNAYIVTSTFLCVFDLTNPASFTVTASVSIPNCTDIVVHNNHAYISTTADTRVYDISTPASPVLTATLPAAQGVAASGHELYILSGTNLIIYELSSPGSPLQIGSLPLGGTGESIDIVGHFAYVTMGTGGVTLVDVTRRYAPLVSQNLPLAGTCVEIAVDGELAYVAAGGPGVHVLSTAYPLLPPIPVRTLDYTDPNTGYRDAHLLYISDPSVTAIWDFTDPRNPVFLSTAPSGGFVADTDGGTMGSGYSDTRLYDLSNPSSPVSLGSYSTGPARDVILDGDEVYVGGGGEIYSLDITDPTMPALLDTIQRQIDYIEKRGFYIYGFAYDAGADRRLTVIDAANPAALSVEGTFIDPAAAFTLDQFTVRGDYAFLSPYFTVVDVKDPTSMSSVATIPSLGGGNDVDISGNYAFVAKQGSGYEFHVVDISDPTNPAIVSSAPTSYLNSFGITVDGNYLFLGNGDLEILQAFERNYDIVANEAYSTELDSSTDEIVRARVNATQVDSIHWQLTADGGGNWETFQPDGQWQEFVYKGQWLYWRTTHYPYPPSVNPTVSQVDIDWLYHYAVIEGVEDIGNDQGRQVRVSWRRSGHEFVGDPDMITEYSVYRAIDPTLYVASTKWEDSRDAQLAAAAPLGWDYIGTVPADIEDDYQVVVPTLADSTIDEGMYYTTFMIRARTASPGVFWDSPPDSGYSLDNLAPSVPASLVAAYNTGSGNQLTWDPAPEADWQYFRVYRSTDPNFTISPATLIDGTTDVSWTDTEYDGGAVYYKVTSVDFSGNESDPAMPESATGTGDTPVPAAYRLFPSSPNPFTAQTRIDYDVPAPGGDIQLKIYDVRGRLVRTLVNERDGGGHRSVTWDGSNNAGARVSSGKYFYRLEGPGFSKTLKMTVLR